MRQVSKWVTIFKVINSPSGCQRDFDHRIDLLPRDVKWMQDKLTVVYPHRWWPIANNTQIRLPTLDCQQQHLQQQQQQQQVALGLERQLLWFMAHKWDRFTNAAKDLDWPPLGRWRRRLWHWHWRWLWRWRWHVMRLIYPAYWLAAFVMGNFMPSASRLAL